MDFGHEPVDENPNSDGEDDENMQCDEADLVECSYPDCSNRVPKTFCIQPIVNETMFYSCNSESSRKEHDFLSVKDKPICESCELKCRRNWTLLNSVCFREMSDWTSIAKKAVSMPVETFENGLQELHQKSHSRALILERVAKISDSLIKNACEQNKEFAKAIEKYSEPKQNPIAKAHIRRYLHDFEYTSSDKDSDASDEEELEQGKKAILRPRLLVGDIIFCASETLQNPWLKGILCKVIINQKKNIYVIKETLSKKVRHLFLKQLAYAHPIAKESLIKPATRVLIKLPQNVYLSGIILYVEKDNGQEVYHVHLDNGNSYSCSLKDIRVICAQSKNKAWRDVAVSERAFIKRCIKTYPDRLLVSVTEGKSVSVYQDGECVSAVVLKIKPNTVDLSFSSGKQETLYLGSLRFKDVRDQFKNQFENRILLEKQGRIRNVEMTQRASEMPFIPHTCSPNCFTPTDGGDPKRYHYIFEKCKEYPTYAVPMLLGWRRQFLETRTTTRVSYVAPCGRRLSSMLSVAKYLGITQSNLEISFFTFEPKVRSLVKFEAHNVKWKCPDYSNGKEEIPIPCVNSIDKEEIDFVEYSTEKILHGDLHLEEDKNFMTCCDCTDNCQDKLKCQCQLLTLSEDQHLRRRKDPKLSTGYKCKILMASVASGIYECNKNCSCHKRLCHNRVTQLPRRHHLELFKTEMCGWGVRTLIDLPSGAFVCFYVGDLYTEDEAIAHGDQGWTRYLADLDLIEVAEESKEGYEDHVSELESSDSDEKTTEDLEQITPEREAGKKFQKFPRSPGSSKSRKRASLDFMNADAKEDRPQRNSRKYFGPKERPFVMDAMDSGNVGRFLNHSCEPNLSVQNCFVDSHDLRYPWVCFFTNDYVSAGEELRWSYGYEDESDEESSDTSPSKEPKQSSSRCLCGTAACRRKEIFGNFV